MKTLEYLGKIKNFGGTAADYCEVIGISESSIYAWQKRIGQLANKKPIPKTFPKKISEEKRRQVITAYDTYGNFFGEWSISKMVGGISASKVGEIIRSIRPYMLRHKEDILEKIRQGYYEFLKRNVCWGWDTIELKAGGFKLMLEILREEFSRYILGWTLTSTVTAEHVRQMLLDAINKYGMPLVFKHDNDTVLKAGLIKRLLEKENILDLPGPAYYAKYQSHHERGNGDIRQLLAPYEANPCITYFELAKKVELTVDFLNNVKPRMNFDGKTSAEMFNTGQSIAGIDRLELVRQVKEIEGTNLWAFPGEKGMKKLHRYAIIEVLKKENFLKVEPRIPQGFLGVLGSLKCSEAILHQQDNHAGQSPWEQSRTAGQTVKQFQGQFLQ